VQSAGIVAGLSRARHTVGAPSRYDCDELMKARSVAHLSDLHIGRDVATEAAARALGRAIGRAQIDHVILSGDVTHRGLLAELELFHDIFAPLLDRNRIIWVPGNHDRLGDDLHEIVRDGARVRVTRRTGLYIVAVDSTGPHNRRWVSSHGLLAPEDIDAIDHALAQAPENVLRIVTMHHHPLPLPGDSLAEQVTSWLGWPFCAELPNGGELLARIRGRCDLLLHGHRHVPSDQIFDDGVRPLRVVNAGSSTSLGFARVFPHDGAGRLGEPVWLMAPGVRDRRSNTRRPSGPPLYAA
jgi:3',5'-cyclic AMP phosphodiesterase CpdA